MHQNRSEQNNTKNKKADNKNPEKKGSRKESGKKGARSRVKDISSEQDKKTSGDVGNDSGKTVTSDGSESDHDGKVNERSVRDDTNNRVGVGVRNECGKKVTKENNSDSSVEEDAKMADDVANVFEATVTKENNSDSFVKEDKSKGVGNDSQKTVKDICNGCHSVEQDIKNESGVSGNKIEEMATHVRHGNLGNLEKSNRDGITGEGTKKSGVVSHESEISGKNVSVVGDNSFADARKSTETVGNESKRRIESNSENEFGEEKTESDMTGNVIQVYNQVTEDQVTTDVVKICDKVNVISEGEVVTPEKSSESEISGKNVSVVNSLCADDRNNIETVGNESKLDQVKVISADEVVTPENSSKSEISGKKVSVVDSSFADDRKNIVTVGNESKRDLGKVISAEVLTPENRSESEISGKNVSVVDSSFADDRKSIETVGNESKLDLEKVMSVDEVLTPEKSSEAEISGKNVSVVDSSFVDHSKSIETVGTESKCDAENIINAHEVLTPENSSESEISGKKFVSVVDSSFADHSKSIETLGTESKRDAENVIHADEVLTPENSSESEISGKNFVSVVDSSFAGDGNSIETGNESKSEQVNVISAGEVVAPEQSDESEISGKNESVGYSSFVDDRNSIETVGNESKRDKVNVSESEVVTPENNEKEEVLPSDFDSSDDDDNVPLSKLKMLSSVSHENTVCFTDIDADNAGSKCDGAYDGSTIEGIIEKLKDNEKKDNESDYRMSMEEYRLTFAQDFLKGGVYDKDTFIKETRHEVDSQIYSQSDTTVTTVTSESLNISSDSEPEIVIHRKKSSKKKKDSS